MNAATERRPKRYVVTLWVAAVLAPLVSLFFAAGYDFSKLWQLLPALAVQAVFLYLTVRWLRYGRVGRRFGVNMLMWFALASPAWATMMAGLLYGLS